MSCNRVPLKPGKTMTLVVFCLTVLKLSPLTFAFFHGPPLNSVLLSSFQASSFTLPATWGAVKSNRQQLADESSLAAPRYGRSRSRRSRLQLRASSLDAAAANTPGGKIEKFPSKPEEIPAGLDKWKALKLVAPKELRFQIRTAFCFGLLVMTRAANTMIPLMCVYDLDWYKATVDALGEVSKVGLNTAAGAIAFQTAVFSVSMYVAWKLTQGLGDAIRQYAWVKVLSDLRKRLSVEVLRHLHSLSLRFHVTSKSGETLQVRGAMYPALRRHEMSRHRCVFASVRMQRLIKRVGTCRSSRRAPSDWRDCSMSFLFVSFLRLSTSLWWVMMRMMRSCMHDLSVRDGVQEVSPCSHAGSRLAAGVWRVDCARPVHHCGDRSHVGLDVRARDLHHQQMAHQVSSANAIHDSRRARVCVARTTSFVDIDVRWFKLVQDRNQIVLQARNGGLALHNQHATHLPKLVDSVFDAQTGSGAGWWTLSGCTKERGVEDNDDKDDQLDLGGGNGVVVMMMMATTAIFPSLSVAMMLCRSFLARADARAFDRSIVVPVQAVESLQNFET
eukprot:2457925-Rhodomonas_salina.3